MEDSETTGMIGLMGRFVRNLPGADFAEEQLQSVERRMLSELKHRMEALEERRLPVPKNYTPPPTVGEDGQAIQSVQSSTLDQHPSDILAELLDRAAEQDKQQAQLYLYSMMLRELVPDEARILGALSDGDIHPLLHIGIGGPIGTPRRVVENLSTVGKAATIKLPALAPAYITHLRNLDLLETGPEDKEFEIKYQILESDRETHKFVEAAKKASGPGMGIKYMRRVIKISPLGKELWEACRPAMSEEE
jgi:hypothetical protein